MALLFSFVFSASLAAQSLETKAFLKFGGVSKHTLKHEGKKVNEFHRTAIFSYNSYFGGYFQNSFYDDSFAVGKTFTTYRDWMKIDLHTGAVYGYRKSGKCYKVQKLNAENDPKRVCPMIAPEVTLHRWLLQPSLAWFGFDALVLNLNIPIRW